MARRSRDDRKAQPQREMKVSQLLLAVAHRNAEAEVQRVGDGALVSIPMARPRWLVPPLSWILPFSSVRRVQLDALGTAVLDLCDGKRTVEQIIETFAGENKLSFREGQLAVTQFLQELVRRGIVALVGASGAEQAT
jgi:hypothetical protein